VEAVLPTVTIGLPVVVAVGVRLFIEPHLQSRQAARIQSQLGLAVQVVSMFNHQDPQLMEARAEQADLPLSQQVAGAVERVQELTTTEPAAVPVETLMEVRQTPRERRGRPLLAPPYRQEVAVPEQERQLTTEPAAMVLLIP
jgi:hypothetical protein